MVSKIPIVTPPPRGPRFNVWMRGSNLFVFSPMAISKFYELYGAWWVWGGWVYDFLWGALGYIICWAVAGPYMCMCWGGMCIVLTIPWLWYIGAGCVGCQHLLGYSTLCVYCNLNTHGAMSMDYFSGWRPTWWNFGAIIMLLLWWSHIYVLGAHYRWQLVP